MSVDFSCIHKSQDICKQCKHHATTHICPFLELDLIDSEEIYACHAAGIVAAANPNWLDELGEVRLEDMSVQWKAGTMLKETNILRHPRAPSKLTDFGPVDIMGKSHYP